MMRIESGGEYGGESSPAVLDFTTEPTVESDAEITQEAEITPARGAARIRNAESEEVDHELMVALKQVPLTKPIGQGGYRMVFDVGNDPDINDLLDDTLAGHFPEARTAENGWVIKIDMAETRDLLKIAEKKHADNPGEYFSPTEAAMINIDEITNTYRVTEIHRRADYREFAQSFESDTTKLLPEVWQAQMVYLPEKYYLQLKGAKQAEIDEATDKLVYVPVWCSFQPKMVETKDRADIGSGSWEHSLVESARTNPADPKSIDKPLLDQKISIYNALMDAFVFEDKRKQAQMTPEVLKQALNAMGTEGQRLVKLFEYVEKSDAEGGNAREALTNFVKSAIKFSQGESNYVGEDKNDRMIDIHGRGNARLITKADGKTECEMADTYLPAYIKPIQQMGDYLEPGRPAVGGAEFVAQTSSYIRTINILAHYLGLEERVHLYQAETRQFMLDYGLGMTQEQIDAKYNSLKNGRAMILETYLLLTQTEVPGKISSEAVKGYRNARIRAFTQA